MLKRVLWPADDCFRTGLNVMTSSLSLPVVGGKKWSTIWCSLIGLSLDKPVKKNGRNPQKERAKLKGRRFLVVDAVLLTCCAGRSPRASGCGPP